MSVGGGYAVACAARHADRVSALGLVSAQPPGVRSEDVETLISDFAPEFLAWRAQVAPDDPDDAALAARCLAMLPPADAALVTVRPPAQVAASVREALADPSGYLRDAATMSRPWTHGPDEVRCPVRAWFGELDDRAEATDFVRRFADVDVTVRPATTHLATLVAHWPDVLGTVRDLSG